MNPRDNAQRIIHFDGPERVATGLPVTMIGYLGCNHEGYDGVGDESPVGTTWTDIWGIVWRKEQKGIMGFPQFHPLADVGSLAGYQWPDPDDERICGPIYQKASRHVPSDRFLAGSHRNFLIEKLEKLIGMEKLLDYFHTEPEYVKDVARKYMDFQIGIAKHYLGLGVEVAMFSEDLGTQTSLLVGPKIIGDFLIPEYKRLLDPYRKRNVVIQLHSCGHVEPLLETLIDLGIHVLNPVQVTANNLETIRSVTQGRMALHGGVNSDTVLKGPTERIVCEVRERLWQLGRHGGYFCNVDQTMDFPEKHIDALRQAVAQYGKYPIENPS